MNTIKQRAVPVRLSLLAATVAALAACGGGSDGDSAPPAPAAQSLQGTAAVGAALAKANVSITDSAGAAVCQETTLVTSDLGSYSCTLQSGKTAPFFVVVTDPDGTVPPLVSVGTATPVAGTPLTVNATPLTTAIVAQLSPDRSALSVVGQPSLLDSAALQSATGNVLNQLSEVLTSLNAPADYNPFTTPITAATASVSGNTADHVVDVLKISTVAGTTMIATVDKPSSAVPLAGPADASPPKLPAPGDGVATLSEAMKLFSAGLQKCFGHEVAQRVLSVNDNLPTSEGGPEVLEIHTDCHGIVAEGYLHNGYRGGQQFYGLLNDAQMTGATFSLPELMLLIDDATPADRDLAVLNIRYRDKNSVAGNLIVVARKVPGSSSATWASDWQLWGNQHPVHTLVQPVIRRREQLAPNPGTAPFANAPTSRFESGFNFFINKDGPGSTGMRAVRVKGPGLPPAGLVYTRPDPSLALAQNWMNLRRKDGNTDPAAATYAGNVGNSFILQRTLGLSGTDATTMRPQPNQSNGNNTQFINWAHPVDYGLAPGSANFIDFSQLQAMVTYQFEVFYDGETAPRHTLDKTLLTPVVPAVNASALQWVNLTAETRQYLDPAHALAASTPSIALAWTANPYAETILSAGVYTGAGGVPVNQGQVPVARGATSATANAPVRDGSTVLFPALSGDGTSYRQIQLRYRMLDGSYKDSMTQFN